MRVIDVLHSPWAIRPDRLIEIGEIYSRHLRGEKISEATISLIEAAIGKPLKNEDEGYQVVNGVAVIPVNGVLSKKMNMFTRISGGTSTELLGQDIKAALADPAVKGVILNIDSPGGTVDGTQELANLIYASRGDKPICTYCNGMMASAAYWIGSAADRAYISGDTVDVGSIGVVTSHTDYSEAYKQRGVKVTELTAGKYKRIASEYAPLTDSGKAYIQDQLDHIYNVFLSDVGRNRGGMAVDQVHDQMADGKIFIGQKAVDAGLVDGMMDLEDLIGMLSNGAMPPKGKNQPSASASRADASMQASLTHNSELADNEPDWGTWLGANRAKLPDTAFADEKGRGYPHHWVKDGKTGKDGKFESGDMYLHRGGLDSAWAAANGARTGQKASPEIISHLQKHRKAIGLEKSN